MNDINSLTITGRLTRDPELKYTQAGLAIAKFSLASERAVKKGESWDKETSFFDCQVWGKPAEWADKDLSKGSAVTIQGEIRQERWEKDGEKRSKVIINCDKLIYAKAKTEDGYQVETPEQETMPEASKIGFDDDIPF